MDSTHSAGVFRRKGENNMRCMHLVTVLALSLGALVFAYSQSPAQGPQISKPTTQQFTLERQVSTQQRINRYFHGDIMPKLKNCWSNVQGKGTIALKYTFTKAGARWIFSRLETEETTLPGDRAKVALRCMSDAVRGSSFPVEGADTAEDTFVLNWTWPVPFPANAAQLTSAMFAAKPSSGGSGDGGCDGHGAPAKCYTCSSKDASCLAVCVGIDEPCTVRFNADNKITGCSVAGNKCASGGLFGVSGGSRVIY
jgi:hypothetical protein